MFLSGITILPFDSAAALKYGSIRFDLKSNRQIIGANDMLIAAHARTPGLILVTHNTDDLIL